MKNIFISFLSVSLLFGLAVQAQILQQIEMQLNSDYLLHVAAYQNDLEIVKQLLEQGADITEQDEQGLTAAHWAALQDNLEVFQFISSQGGNVLQKSHAGYSPFDLAISKNNQKVVKWLVSQHRDFFINKQGVQGNTPLLLATIFSHDEMVQFLIERGADLETTNDQGLTPLIATVLTNDVEMAKLLVKKGAQIDYNTNMNPLYLAASNNSIEVARFLIEQGADVNKEIREGYLFEGVALVGFGVPFLAGGLSAASPFVIVAGASALAFGGYLGWDARDISLMRETETYKKARTDIASIYDTTPLHVAAFKGHSEMVDLLIQYGADVNLQSEIDYTPLHFATQEGHLEIAKKLLNRKADINLASHNGTPLYVAVMNDHMDMVNLLLTEAADPNIITKAETPLDLALEKGNLPLANVLRNHGAQLAKDI